MPRARRTSGSLGRTRLRATCWPIALQRRSSIGARRARRACLVPQLEEEGFSMDLLMSNRPSTLGFLAALMLSLSAPTLATDRVKINDLVIASQIPEAQRDATVKAVRAFY